MNEIYILNRDFTLEGIIDEYSSIIWRTSYLQSGDFEIYIAASERVFDLMKNERYVVRKRDVSVKNGVNRYKDVMIIKNIQLITDVENGDFMCITGRDLKYLLHQRIVWKQTNISMTAEDGIRKLIEENAINPTDSRRVIPGMALAERKGLTKRISIQTTGDYLDEIINKICLACDYGWNVEIQGDKIIISVYEGVNRSYSQNERPFVVFSDEFENLYNTEYAVFTENYANVSLVAGEGEGVERKFVCVNEQAEGFERFENFCDARDLSSNSGSDREISPEEYERILKERGMDNIIKSMRTENFSGEMISDMSFIFNTDFFLGDLVTVINQYGIQKDVRVMGIIESEDETGIKTLPQFNI